MIKTRENGHKYTSKDKSWRLVLWGKKGRLFESDGVTNHKNILEFTTEKLGLDKAKSLGITLIVDELE